MDGLFHRDRKYRKSYWFLQIKTIFFCDYKRFFAISFVITATTRVNISVTGIANQMPDVPNHKGNNTNEGMSSTVRKVTMRVARRIFSRL